jgi:hypothetical protein
MLFAVCTGVAACSQEQTKEDMLAAAGFTIVPANTPQRQAPLKSWRRADARASVAAESDLR